MNLEQIVKEVHSLENRTDLRRFENSKRKFNMNNSNTPVWGDELYCLVQSLMAIIAGQVQQKQMDQETGNELLKRLRRL